MESKLIKLLNKQKNIQEKIQLLLREEMEITQSIENFLIKDSKSRLSEKELLKKKIEKMGFKLSSKTVDNIRTLQLSRENHSIQLIITQSSYHDGHYNAWYTFKPNVEKIADYIIFIYTDSAGDDSYITLDKSILNSIIHQIQEMPDGRVNIKMNANKKSAIEIQSKIDLSSNIGNVNILLEEFV